MRSWSFWKECAKRANKGTSAFANDWQWVYGTPLASAIGVYIASNKGATWVTTGYPIADAFLAALAAFIITWAVAFLHRLYKTAPEMFREQRERVLELEEARKPKLKCSFDMNDSGCKRPNSPLAGTSMRGDWYRLKVEASGDVAVPDCQGRLVEIKRGTNSIVSGEKITLPFAYGNEADATAKTIRPGFAEHLDFLVITYDNSVLLTPHGHFSSSLDLRDLFSLASDYTLLIVIGTGNSLPLFVEVQFRWTLDFHTSEITCRVKSP